MMCLDCHTSYRKGESEQQPTPPPPTGKKRAKSGRKGAKADKSKSMAASGGVSLWLSGRVLARAGRHTLAKINTRVRLGVVSWLPPAALAD